MDINLVNKSTKSKKDSNKKNIENFFQTIWGIKEVGIIIISILYFVIIVIINPSFILIDNLTSIIKSSVYTLIPAIGMTFVLVSGGIDFSIGSTLGLCGFFSALLMTKGNSVSFSIIIGLLLGALIGLINAGFINKFKVPPIIMTLGMYYIARGIVFILTKGVAAYPLPPSFNNLEQSLIPGIPLSIVISIALVIIAHIVLTRTAFGREVRAVGGNSETARLSGINVNRIKLIVYSISGILAAFTGILVASRFESGLPYSGAGSELNVIAAVIIGGTSFSGGSGTILGTVIGVMFLGILSNSMTLLKISVYWQSFFMGTILMIAVVLDQFKKTKTMHNSE